LPDCFPPPPVAKWNLLGGKFPAGDLQHQKKLLVRKKKKKKNQVKDLGRMNSVDGA